MKKELVRMIRSIWFVLGVCFALALCFTSEIVMGDESYTILQVLNHMSRDKMVMEPQLIRSVALRNAFSGYVTLFIPIVSALPMIQLLHIEMQSGWKRFYMSRKSRWKYYWNKWIAGMMSGALLLLVVAVLFHGFMLLTIPETDVLEMMGKTRGDLLWDLVKIYIGIACYGAFSTIPAILISCFTHNYYFMVCLPFMFCYFWDIMMSSLGRFLRMHHAEKVSFSVTDLLFSRSYLMVLESWWDLFVEGMRMVVLLVGLILIYFCNLNRKSDCGE